VIKVQEKEPVEKESFNEQRVGKLATKNFSPVGKEEAHRNDGGIAKQKMGGRGKPGLARDV